MENAFATNKTLIKMSFGALRTFAPTNIILGRNIKNQREEFSCSDAFQFNLHKLIIEFVSLISLKPLNNQSLRELRSRLYEAILFKFPMWHSNEAAL